MSKKGKTHGVRTKRKWFSKDNLQLLTMVLPAMIKVFIFAYFPMWGIIIAFKNFSYKLGPFKSKFVGFKNFEFFFVSNDAGRVLFNTVFMNAIFIVTGMLASVLLALLMYQVTENRFRLKAYQTMMFFPYFVSWVVAGMLLSNMIGGSGLITNLLLKIGVTYNFYSEPSAWRYILPLANIWKSGGYSCIIYYGILIGTDTTLYEAARIDGASNVQIMLRLQIPFLKPMLVLNALAAVAGIFRADFGMFFYLPGANNSLLFKTTDVIDTYVFRAIQGMGDLSMGAAVGLFQSAVGFVLITAANKLSRMYDPDYGIY